MKYYFRIADLLICIHTQLILDKFYELENYRASDINDQEVDIEYTIEIINGAWKKRGEKIQEVRKTAVYETNESYFKYFFWSVHTEEKFIILEQRKNDYQHFNIYIPKKGVDSLFKEFHLSAFLSIERPLLQYNAFQLHASVIAWNGRGILFSAPSGTGKSTQANLWEKYENAKILNGDRAIIRKKNNRFKVYGSPYAGTSGVYTNISVPICAIVILAQGKENYIKKLKRIEAFKKIYSESTICAWDQFFIMEFVVLLVGLINDIPVYYLSCRPEKAAVDLLKKVMLNENGI